MTTQLTLIHRPTDWRLDAKTRKIGLAGVAKARELLAREPENELVVDLTAAA